MKILLILLTDLLIRIHIVGGDGCWAPMVCDGAPGWRKITPCNQELQTKAMKGLYKLELQKMTDQTAAMSNQLNDMRKMRELLELRTDETRTLETAIEDKVETTTHNIGTSAVISETTSVHETLEQATQTTDRSMETTSVQETLEKASQITVRSMETEGCPRPGPADTSLNSMGFKVGTVITHRCKTGYQITDLNMDMTTKCLNTFLWSATQFVCVRQVCGHPGTITNGQLEGDSFEFGDSVTYACDRGYVIEGSATRRCNADSVWIPDEAIPVCTGVKSGEAGEAIRLPKITNRAGSAYPPNPRWRSPQRSPIPPS